MTAGTKAPNETGTTETIIPFLLPHELCHAIVKAGARQA